MGIAADLSDCLAALRFAVVARSRRVACDTAGARTRSATFDALHVQCSGRHATGHGPLAQDPITGRAARLRHVAPVR
jgi:hypothetical protein